FTPFKGFSYRSDVSYDEVNVKHRLFKDAHDVSVKDILEKNFLERSLAHYSTITWENIVNYNFELAEKHRFNLMVGQTTEEYNYYSIGNSGSNILNPSEKNWYLSQTTEDNVNPAGDGVSRSRRLSFLGRAHYSLLDRYMFTFNFRADGSNKFPENTWGYFPSFAAAWRISEEPWLKDKWSALDFLKLRAGWGQIGNDKIGNDAFNQTIFTTGPTFVGYPFDGVIANGATILTYVNQGGMWERTETWNAGIDAAFWNGRLSFTLEGFIRNTKDMLLWVKGPAWVGNRYDAQSNVGTVRNTGIELTIGHRNHFGEFNYSVDGNVSFIKNELTALNGGAPVYGDRVLSDEGLPLFTYWGYEYEGVYKSDEEANKKLWGYAASGAVNPYVKGDAIYKDINGDGIINDDDKTKLGNNFPKVSFGLNIGADWRGIDLQLFFQGVAGNKIYNAMRERLEGTGSQSVLSPEMVNVWSYDEEGIRVTDYAKADIPNPRNSINFFNSSRFIENGSYLRLKNVQLGYTLPKAWLSKVGVKNVRVYAQMSNVFTITKYKGFDPEVAGGVDYGNYPQARTFLMGANLTF
ncbi:MAG: SusC/RagA family TonB-linked outer membrane protein, partial [Muribaculaceae bacterium]|nr:SusC/RagA family TonB-linked outer membrane protein [Muribaculaceae bacterium]